MIVGSTALLVSLLLWPSPLTGDWVPGDASLSCMCDSHNFIRFEDGKILLVRALHPPPEWIGEYHQTGIASYTLHFWDMETHVVHPGPFVMWPIMDWWLFRDRKSESNQRIMSMQSHQQIVDIRAHLTVSIVNGCPSYSNRGHLMPFQKVKEYILKLRALKPPPLLQVYSHEDAIPIELKLCLTEDRLEYAIQPLKTLQRGTRAR